MLSACAASLKSSCFVLGLTWLLVCAEGQDIAPSLGCMLSVPHLLSLCCWPELQDEIRIPVADQIDLTTMPVEDNYDGPRLGGEVSQCT